MKHLDKCKCSACVTDSTSPTYIPIKSVVTIVPAKRMLGVSVLEKHVDGIYWDGKTWKVSLVTKYVLVDTGKEALVQKESYLWDVSIEKWNYFTKHEATPDNGFMDITRLGD